MTATHDVTEAYLSALPPSPESVIESLWPGAREYGRAEVALIEESLRFVDLSAWRRNDAEQPVLLTPSRLTKLEDAVRRLRDASVPSSPLRAVRTS